mmetsp:Transcript_3735/g.8066  ORF Transcript_3735/g.8066 Transcript_3735/m.8066 type:complete len:340 (+) Transcript_3735:101-1120(+)|eukprot:CAMPEP_0168756616 /NCGR_PEP_ID=MMETSP0724-20121128/20712_1 /TAXON_ID=265536 /ORGANISM="Amphiprora sp., Strain CCMP467" /LENGTH=339 /DNA_ID=CAMNT_0008805339 /DNA_START=34 /DNA_END=1053 /DNA_ORIENTATION=-
MTDNNSNNGVPVISLSESNQNAAAELVKAFEEIGFATLVDHGVDRGSMQAAFDASGQFFQLPIETKMESRYQSHDSNRGYIPFQAEKFQTNPDHKETFDIGWDKDHRGQEAPPFTTPWPKEKEGPDVKQRLLAYFEACDDLNLRVMRLLAEGMKLEDPDFFVNRCNERHCNLRLLYYPQLLEKDYSRFVNPKEDVLVRGGRHTDYGTITLLAQDDVGGLRVQRRGSTEWFPVPPVPNSFVVNVGDMLERWTNGRLMATPHQVVHYFDNNPHRNEGDNGASSENSTTIKERYSIAFFCNANKDVVLDTSDFVAPGETPRFEPVKAIDYITQRLTATISSM